MTQINSKSSAPNVVPLFTARPASAGHSPQCGSCTVGLASKGRCPFRASEYRSRAVVVSQGEEFNRLYFIAQGQVILSSVDADGVEQQMTVRSAPSLLGVEALRGGEAQFRMEALGPVKVCTLPTAEADAWLGSAPPPWRALLGLLSAEVDRLRNDFALRSGSCLSRLARFLASRASPQNPNALLGIPKQDIAHMLGMRPETFSRCLAQLQRRGYIAVSRRGTRILNVPGLAALHNGA
jgi:CRP/FNR family transcriptional regulator, cyclic AMP receptor protein